ncbi:MAG: sensor histidine kinase [Betaproteobacteria bacterium]|nr:sensor histidine kinase [Betaproteobacteria bacterium]
MTSSSPSALGSQPALLVRARRWVILAMLLSLHAALVSQSADFQRVWLLVHFGLFLIWQPIYSTEREVKVAAMLLLVGITAVVMFSLAGWMLAMWLAILIGIMGGKVFTAQAARRTRFYLVAVFYLFTILLVWTVPRSLLDIEILPPGLTVLAELFLPLTLLTLVFLPFRAEDESTTQVFDFVYSLIVFQLVIVMVLGSIAAMRVTGNQYFQAVLLTVLSFAVALFVLAVLWAPRTGYGGLRTYLSRYLLSVGMPFELWMRRVAELSETEISSARFLESTIEEVAKFPWITGGEWKTPDGTGRFGKSSDHVTAFKYHQLEITFYTQIHLSPAMFLHLRLLAQVIGEFYEGKRREQALKENAYMQAVHETGARLTHDVKNLLQSLYALTSAGMARVEHERREKSAYQQLLERQLPTLAKRLETTLDKLQNPEVGIATAMLPAGDWWQEVVQRHQADGITLFAGGDLSVAVPANLFDAMVENCVENAKKKRATEPDIAIEVVLDAGGSVPLTVRDTGSAIPSGALDSLFSAPIASSRRGGLGIGLYQVARQAERAGFELRLRENRSGAVCFVLSARQPD